ncbi:hypothetical protein GCM10010218_21720 [Streptomyces mashuensis]|uniref:Uncharacterized protein n=1 Tax=Streptomyces mashuensis TaxID=33904 RepID=A0A919B127_9ACTN|nr:hypothetical protein GCM10010218_21720 [Streptomyces mashuensis]
MRVGRQVVQAGGVEAGEGGRGEDDERGDGDPGDDEANRRASPTPQRWMPMKRVKQARSTGQEEVRPNRCREAT